MTLRRPILALTAGLAALPVAGCSYLAGPTPDEGLVALGQSLRDAAGQAADSGEAELLSSHADEVFDEVIRLCGTTEQGALPQERADELIAERWRAAMWVKPAAHGMDRTGLGDDGFVQPVRSMSAIGG